MIRRLSLLIIMFVAPNYANAFNTDLHEKSTVDAINLYDDCRDYFPEKLTLDLSSDVSEATVVHANQSVDGFYISRACNWHFYDSQYNWEMKSSGNIPTNFLSMNRSLHYLFINESRKLDDLVPFKDDEKLKRQIGIVMHYIQDMAVPAHVAPVYHVSWRKDEFDGYGEQLAHKFCISEAECSVLLGKTDTPRSILQDLADSTLESVKSKTNDQISWSDFWNVFSVEEKPDGDGFSDYGKCRNSFGNAEKVQDDYVPDECVLDPDIYENFFRDRYKDTVYASLQLLISSGKKIEIPPLEKENP